MQSTTADIGDPIAIRVRLDTAIYALGEAQKLIPQGESLGFKLFALLEDHIGTALAETRAARDLCKDPER